MAKDPAFLFYSSDFLTGTMLMSNEQVGKYIRLLCLQHQKGFLTDAEIKRICGELIDDEILDKFEFADGKYFNVRLQEESEKRKKYAESRRNNRLKLNNDNCHIYFIRNRKNNLIKIGSSVNPRRRLIELQDSENNLEILFYTDKTSQQVESMLHKHFQDFNSFNEWFDIYWKIEEIKELLSDMNINIITDMSNHMISHMENENENINSNVVIPVIKKNTLPKIIEKTIFSEFLEKNCPTVLKLKIQMTAEQAQKLADEFGVKDCQEIFEAMENWMPLSKKSKSVYLTAKTWLTKRKTTATTNGKSKRTFTEAAMDWLNQ